MGGITWDANTWEIILIPKLVAARLIQRRSGIHFLVIVLMRTSLTRRKNVLQKNLVAILEASKMEVQSRQAQVTAPTLSNQLEKSQSMSLWGLGRQARDGVATMNSADLVVKSMFQTEIEVLVASGFGTGSGTPARTRIESGRQMIFFFAVTHICRETETCPLQHVISISKTFTEITCPLLLVKAARHALVIY